MRHLTPQDVIDVLDGCASGDVAAHVELCNVCHGMVNEAREGLRMTAEDEVPEPSPLFWPRLSERIQDSVRHEPAPRQTWWGGLWYWNPVRFAVIAGLVLVVSVVVWNGRAPAGSDTSTVALSPIASVPVGDDLAPPPDDEPWAIVTGVMADTSEGVSAAEALTATVGSADRAAGALTDAERVELARLLRAKLDEP